MASLTVLVCLLGLIIVGTSRDVTRRTEDDNTPATKMKDKLELELEELQARRGSLTSLFHTKMRSSPDPVPLRGGKKTSHFRVSTSGVERDLKHTVGETLHAQPTKQSQLTSMSTRSRSPLSLLLGILQALDRTKKQDAEAIQFTKTQQPVREHHRLNRLYNDATLDDVWEPLILENEADLYVTSAPSRLHGNSKQKWPHFLYQRVTESPQDIISLSHHGHHHNAYIAVSAVTTPKLRARNQHLIVTTPASHHEQLPDSMDALITKISQPPLHHVTSTSHVKHEGMTSPENVASEEQEIEDLVQSGWNHEEHRQKLKDQRGKVKSLEERWHHLSRGT